MTKFYPPFSFSKPIKISLLLLAILLYSSAVTYGQDLEQLKKLIGKNRGNVSAAGRGVTDNFGYAVAVDGNYAVVGAYQEDEDAEGNNTLNNPGSAYIYKKTAGVWQLKQKIVASNRTASNLFGWTVAIQGEYIMVGARQRTQTSTTTGNSTYAGAAYVFKRTGEVWNETQEIMASFRGSGTNYRDAFFGSKISMHNGYAIISAPQESGDASARVQYAGAAYLFKLNGETWTEEKRIVSPTPIAQGYFGNGVAIYNDQLLISEMGPSTTSGRVYVYKHTNNDWTLQQTLTDAGAPVGSSFGADVSIYDHQAIIGASGWKQGSTNYGAGYIYTFNTANNQWELKKQLLGNVGNASASFGLKVAINDQYAFISAHNEKDGTGLLYGAIYSYKLDDPNWTAEKIIANDRTPINSLGSTFGVALALDGSQIFIGAATDGTDEQGKMYKERAGAAYAFDLTNDTWSQSQKIIALEKTMDNYFGYAVATSGNYTIVGAPQESEDENGNPSSVQAGKAYLFKRSSSGVWDLQKELVASDRNDGDNFGSSVAISGEYAMVGANKADFSDGSTVTADAGAVYIFKLESNTWVEKAKLMASDPTSLDYFGSTVSITENHAVIGAYNKTNNGLASAGAAYIFKNNGGTWEQQQKMLAPIVATGHYFGNSVAIYGKNIAIGSQRHVPQGVTGSQMGIVYTYALNEATQVWEAGNPLELTTKVNQDLFGTSVNIKGDYTIVGAHQRDPAAISGTGTVNNAGAAYIFKKSGTQWNLLQEIIASDREATDFFGYAVAINGQYAIVGAYQEDATTSTSNNAGAAYIFKKEINQANQEIWTEYQKIVPSSRNAGDNFGWAVAIDAYAIVGAHLNDTDENEANTVQNAGATYIFGIPDQTLPVKLISFSAKADGNVAKLNWQTATETNNQKFVVYRSGDDKVFNKLTEIVGSNHSNAPKSYGFTDRNPLNGNNYYRLTQVDFNGDVSELGIQSVSFSLNVNTLTIYPNPTADRATLTFDIGNFNELQLIDMQGKVLKTSPVSKSDNQATVDLSNQTTGLYLLKLIGPKVTEIKKVIRK